MRKSREDTDVLNAKGFRGTWKTTAQTAVQEWMVKKMFDYGADLQNAYDEGYKKGKADAVRHGRWELDKETGSFFCSECNSEALLKAVVIGGCLQELSEYCPNCGAKMDKEKRDDED